MRHSSLFPFIVTTITSLLCLSCVEKESNSLGRGVHHATFHAFCDPEAKTVLQDDGRVFWSPGDEIAVFALNSDEPYKLSSDIDYESPSVDFYGDVANSDTYYAVYPYNEDLRFLNGRVLIEFPSVQIAKEGSFERNTFVSVAVSRNDNLYFNNICGGIKFSVSQSGIRRIVFENNEKDKFLSGWGFVSFDHDDNPSFNYSYESSSSRLTVLAPENGTFEVGKYYYAVIPATELREGITVTYYTDNTYSRYMTDSTNISKSTFKRLYDKDEGLDIFPYFQTKAYLSPETIFPEGVNRSLITEIHFNVLDERTTQTRIYSPMTDEDSEPIYFELEGSVANYYTKAECYQTLSMRSMFSGCLSLESLDLSNFDTSENVSTESMFENCQTLMSINFSNFDTSNVTDFQWMFSGCNSIETIDLSGFNTTKAERLDGMFQWCTSLTRLNLTGFDVPNVVSMSSMFNSCYSLEELDMNSFKTTCKLRDMVAMFMGCRSLKSVDLSGFDTSGVTDIHYMFGSCESLKSLDLSNFRTPNITSLYSMFSGCSSLEDLDISGFSTGNVTEMRFAFQGCGKLKYIDIGGFDTRNVVDMSSMFSGCSSLRSLDVSKFDTSNVESFAGMFSDCSALMELDVSHFVTDRAINLGSMFSGCSSISYLDVKGFNTYNAQYISGMFSRCSSLIELDLSSFNTAKVEDMESMFFGCTSLKKLDISSFNTSNVTSFRGMFRRCVSLKSLDLSTFDTSKATDMSFMFGSDPFLESGVMALESLNLSNFNTSNVKNMSYMFSFCSNLQSLDVSMFDTSKVEDMCAMFQLCASLYSLDLSNFNTANVSNMAFMFSICSSLTDINIRNFDTSRVIDMTMAFQNCSSLKSLDLSNFKTMNVGSMNNMFANVTSPIITTVIYYGDNFTFDENIAAPYVMPSSMKILNLSGFNVNSACGISEMFKNCVALCDLDISTFHFGNQDPYEMFQGVASVSKCCVIHCIEDTKESIMRMSIDTMPYLYWDVVDDNTSYASIDYSADGVVKKIQSASVGNGIDIVIMGDAYTDRLISDGSYDIDVNKTVSALFGIEPFKSLRDYFNVFEVYAVSKNEELSGLTALHTSFGGGSLVSGSDYRVIEYAQKAINNLDESLVVVLINSHIYAGTTYMYQPSSKTMYGSGLSIVYIPLGTTDDEFTGLVQHEAGGHGFAKLADEYYYEDNGFIDEQTVADVSELFEYGWYSNIDFEPHEPKWEKFMLDSEFSYENISVFEGGYEYPYGVWRPTEFSIMRYNNGGFNAPSREAIYIRAQQLALGGSWEYSYDDFVRFDKLSRGINQRVQTIKSGFHFSALHSPIIRRQDWRNVKR